MVAVAKSTYCQLQLVQQLHPFLDKKDLASVTHGLVSSQLEYCNTLCVATQEDVMKIIDGPESGDQSTDMLDWREPSLLWPLRSRITFQGPPTWLQLCVLFKDLPKKPHHSAAGFQHRSLIF